MLEPHYENTEPGFIEQRNRVKEILQKEDDLAEIVQLVGKSALGESDKITLEGQFAYRANLVATERRLTLCLWAS